MIALESPIYIPTLGTVVGFAGRYDIAVLYQVNHVIVDDSIPGIDSYPRYRGIKIDLYSDIGYRQLALLVHKIKRQEPRSAVCRQLIEVIREHGGQQLPDTWVSNVGETVCKSPGPLTGDGEQVVYSCRLVHEQRGKGVVRYVIENGASMDHPLREWYERTESYLRKIRKQRIRQAQELRLIGALHFDLEVIPCGHTFRQ